MPFWFPICLKWMENFFRFYRTAVEWRHLNWWLKLMFNETSSRNRILFIDYQWLRRTLNEMAFQTNQLISDWPFGTRSVILISSLIFFTAVVSFAVAYPRNFTEKMSLPFRSCSTAISCRFHRWWMLIFADDLDILIFRRLSIYCQNSCS